MIHVIFEITSYGPAGCVVNFSQKIFLAQSLHFQARYFMCASSFPNDYLAYYMPYIRDRPTEYFKKFFFLPTAILGSLKPVGYVDESHFSK